MQTDHVRDHIAANGVRTYYEAVGTGEPLVLLHGGACTIQTLAPQVPALSARHRVYMPERRGHGRTPDVAGPITYAAMAADTIAFMTAVGLESAHLVGWSDGALVALLVAMERPDLVRKLVFIGQYINISGLREKFAGMAKHLSRETFPPMFEAAYAAVSPDGPGHWPVVFEKLRLLFTGDPAIPLTRLRDVKTPTLVMLADDDLVSVAHATAIQEALPDAQLAVVPGTSHALPMEKPDVVNRLILDFLAVEQAPKLFGKR